MPETKLQRLARPVAEPAARVIGAGLCVGLALLIVVLMFREWCRDGLKR